MFHSVASICNVLKYRLLCVDTCDILESTTFAMKLASSTLPSALRGPAVITRRNNRSNAVNVTAMAGHGRFFVGGAYCSPECRNSFG